MIRGAAQIKDSRPLFVIGAIWLIGVFFLAAPALSEKAPNTIVLSHWANGHMMSEALLPSMADRFNEAGYKTASGLRIEVRPVLVNSGIIAEGLIGRLKPGAPSTECEATGCRPHWELPDPTIVTPVAEHWLTHVNYAVGETILDLAITDSIAETWVGIVTYDEMARCLGWPDREVGFAEVLELAADDRGWETCPLAKADWGKEVLISYTDPSSSSTGRSMLIALYAVAAGKPPDQLSVEDVTRPEVVEYVKQFQLSVDNYVPDTLILNTNIFQGPDYGHFFFIAEDNLVKLYKGLEPVTVGPDTHPRPIQSRMVMIYPKEGAIAHRYPAALVRAPWVSEEQAEAARKWVAYVRQSSQQEAFMKEGFRPARNSTYPAGATEITPKNGLDPRAPLAKLDVNSVQPAVADTIVRSWGEVKNASVVTFVLDTSPTMSGAKLEQARQGLTRAVDAFPERTDVGLITSVGGLRRQVDVAPITKNRVVIGDVVRRVQTDRAAPALGESILEAVRITDSAPAHPRAIRGIVVLIDGKASSGLALHNLVQMASEDGKPIAFCPGFSDPADCLDNDRRVVPKERINGTGLVISTEHRIRMFFVAIGPDFDAETCRILAEATSSECKRTAEDAIGDVIRVFSKYF